jgi:hypothetical protein
MLVLRVEVQQVSEELPIIVMTGERLKAVSIGHSDGDSSALPSLQSNDRFLGHGFAVCRGMQ